MVMSFQVTKLLGAEWSSLTPEQKAAFVTRSEQDKRRYRNELQAYRQSHDYQLLLRKKRIKSKISEIDLKFIDGFLFLHFLMTFDI